MKKPKNSQKCETGLSALARQLGVTRQSLAHHMRKPGAPELSDVDGWQIFIAAHGREGTSDPDLRRKIAQRRLAILEQAERKAKRENQIADHEVVQFYEVQKYALEVNGFFFQELDRLKQQLPSLLKGRTELEIFQELEKQIPAIKTALRTRLQAIEAKP